jgi:hypothetical protein
MRPMNRIVAAFLITFLMTMAWPAVRSFAGPARYRDLQLYTTSAPDPADAGRVVATMRVVNRGALALDLRMNLDANPAAAFAGSTFEARVEAGKEGAWKFGLKPPEGFKRQTLKGTVTFGTDAEPDRELYVEV